MSVLTVKNLSKHFGNFKAVDDISFELEQGEILGLLGPNGAGKTTTIQMLLGVLTPTSGDISYFGKSFEKHREEILEKVNFSSTYTNLPWSLSVYENLHYTSYLYKIADRKKRIESVIEHFRLKELVNHQTSELSAGQLTRMNIAKAFINYPRILLLDEPTASLDPEVAQFVRQFILSQREHYKVSIIFTSHNMTEVEEVCDRILFISNGKIIANDTPENLSRSIKECQIQLTIPNCDEAVLFAYMKENRMKANGSGIKYTIELEEGQIPELLTFLGQKNIKYIEINIDKPDLEDYFLKIALQSNGGKEL